MTYGHSKSSTISTYKKHGEGTTAPPVRRIKLFESFTEFELASLTIPGADRTLLAENLVVWQCSR